MPYPCCAPHCSVCRMSMSSVPCSSSMRFLYWCFSFIDVDNLLPVAVDCLLLYYGGAHSKPCLICRVAGSSLSFYFPLRNRGCPLLRFLQGRVEAPIESPPTQIGFGGVLDTGEWVIYNGTPQQSHGTQFAFEGLTNPDGVDDHPNASDNSLWQVSADFTVPTDGVCLENATTVNI